MRRRLTWATTVLAVVSVGALAGAGSAAAAPREFFGLVPQGKTPPPEDIQRMGRGNVGTVRFLLNWAAVEPQDNQFDFSGLDDYLGDLAAEGIRPLPFVWSVPRFVSNDSLEMPVGSASDREQWQAFLREIVGRYGPGGTYWTTVFPTQHPGEQALPVDTWQIWNEQNAPKHVDKPDPAGYAQLLKISDAAITAEDPSAEIILGGMFGKPTGKGGLKAWSFLKRLYKTKGVKAAFDGVSIHPYSPDVKGIQKQIKKVRKVLKKKKDKGADVWITELGWGSKKQGRLGVGKKKQAKLLKQSFKVLKKKRGKWNIGAVIWYTWRDLGNAPCDWCGSAGLFGQNGFDPKPAWNKFIRFTGGS